MLTEKDVFKLHLDYEQDNTDLIKTVIKKLNSQFGCNFDRQEYQNSFSHTCYVLFAIEGSEFPDNVNQYSEGFHQIEVTEEFEWCNVKDNFESISETDVISLGNETGVVIAVGKNSLGIAWDYQPNNKLLMREDSGDFEVFLEARKVDIQYTDTV